MERIGRVADADTTPRLSVRARALGLMSVTDVKLAVLRQQPVWWNGSQYHCPVCEADFASQECGSTHHCRPAPRPPHGLILSPSFSSLAPTRWSPGPPRRCF